MDRISSLPDNVLYHILSFLPMNYVVATSLLARRWRNLWTSVPNLDFDADKFNDRAQISKVISLCLMRYEGLKVHKFRVSLPILSVDHCFIDTWISFAKKHNVEELDLDFSDGLYEVPWHLSNCDTLKVLNLSWCSVTHPFRFLSLKKLYLHDGLLLDLDTSGIPLLEDLVVSRCNYNGSLSIHAPNPKLRYLNIYDPDDCGYMEVVIHAPHLLSFEIVGCLRGRYDIKDFSSITNVNLNFNDMFIHGGDDDFVAGGLRELLKNVRHANNLKLSQWCIQVLSMLDAQNLEIPVLNATCLELETNLNKWELPGITCVLKNSPRLQTLIINFSFWDTRAGIWHLNEDVFENIDPWEILELVLSLSRLQLKTVKLNNLLWTEYDAHAGNIDLNECLKYAGNLIKLLRLLLMCCSKLDTVIIKEAPLFRDSPVKSQLLHHLSKELRVRSMASANVEICFA